MFRKTPCELVLEKWEGWHADIMKCVERLKGLEEWL